MQPTPVQTAITAVAACTAGLLAAWLIPAFLLSLAVGAVTYLAVILAIAKTTRLDPLALAVDTTRLCIRLTAATITTLASLALNALAAWDHAIRRAQQPTTRIYSRAA